MKILFILTNTLDLDVSQRNITRIIENVNPQFNNNSKLQKVKRRITIFTNFDIINNTI